MKAIRDGLLYFVNEQRHLCFENYLGGKVVQLLHTMNLINCMVVFIIVIFD